MKRFACWLGGMCAIVFLVVWSISSSAFDMDFYHSFYAASSLPGQLEVSLTDMDYAMSLMLEYLQGRADNLDGTITIANESREVYNAREKAHMADVKALWQNARLAGRTGFLMAAAIWAVILLLYKKQGLLYIAAGFRDAGLCFLIFLAFMGLWAATNFTDFWIHFHELFFTNDLWLLNPATDFMINICPEDLFARLILRICLRFLVFFVPGMIMAVVYCQRKVYQSR